MVKLDIKKHIPYFVLILVGVLVFILNNQFLATTDAQRYAVLSSNLIQGRGYALAGEPELIFPPGYSLLLAPFVFFTANLELSVSLLMAISVLTLGILAFNFLSRKMGVAVGFAVTLLVLLNGNFLLWAGLGNVEIVWLLFLFASFYYFDLENKGNHLFSGLLAGIAYLLKPETLGFVFVYLLICFITAFPKMPLQALLIKQRKQLTKKFAYFLSPLVLIIALYSVFLFIHTDKLALSGKIATLEWDTYIENPDVAREQAVYRLNEDLSVGPTLRNYSLKEVDLIKRVKANLFDFKQALYELTVPFKAVILVLSMIFIFFKDFRKNMFLSFIFLIPTAMALFFHIERRYLSLIFFVVVFWLVRAGVNVFNKKTPSLGRMLSLVALAVLGLMTYYSYYPLRAEAASLIREKSTYLQLAESFDFQDKIIIARKPVYSYLKNDDYYPLPWVGNKNELERFLSRRKGAIIILDGWSKETLTETHELILELDKEGKIGQQLVIFNR